MPAYSQSTIQVALAVVDEVRVQQVVVARHAGALPARVALDPVGDVLRLPYASGIATPVAAAVSAVGLDDAERVEDARGRRPVVEAPSAATTGATLWRPSSSAGPLPSTNRVTRQPLG